MAMSPTARSLDALRKAGYRAAVVERYNAFSRMRVDLFGIFDIVAIGQGRILFVQTTTAGNMASRRTKMLGADNGAILAELAAVPGAVVELHGWVKRGRRWECKREILVPVLGELAA